ncbi:RNA polymerase II elongation factor ELL2-like [Dama dama]|uniref:RNA polymerase II elongation factor ELL2-like n=1 Tax=Dama dama TaxID=30532 RepID=UPI002A361861|nr:RNA polymerase II elongation factor ELL2-like [Dama dama]
MWYAFSPPRPQPQSLPMPVRCDYMKASRDREVGEVVRQEGEVAVDKVVCIEPRQVHDFVLPRQFPRPAIQAIDSCGNHGNTVMPQSYLQFQGLPELMKISPDISPTDGYRFHFQLSNVDKDNHQDHMQQDVSSYCPLEPSCLHLLQDKDMECTAIYSELLMQVRKRQADEESCNKWKYIRPCGAKRMPIRKAPRVIPDPVPERKRTAPVNLAYTVRKSRMPNSVHTRPYRERVIHLLALKDYRKRELLIRLQRDGMTAEDKDSVEKILQEVAHLNTKDLSYSLKNCVFKELQRDWPGYNELDRQALELVLARKVNPFLNVTGTDHPKFSIGSSTDEIFFPSQEQLYNSADIDYSKNKKVRISHLTTKQQSASSGHLNNASEMSALGHPPCFESITGLSSPSLPNIHIPTSNSLQPVYSKCSYSSITEGPETQDPRVDRFSQSSKIFECQQGKHSLQTLASISVTMNYPKHMEKQHSLTGEKFKYKSMEYKAKSKEHSIKILEKQQTDSEGQDEGAKPNSSEEVAKVCTPTEKTCSTSELPDYLTSYVTIISSEQCERYEQEFRVDYEEYKALHEKLLPFSKIFVSLTSKKEQFTPDSREYEAINKKISLEYQKMKEMNHNYFEEKLRCQYLYNKLAHIKELINNYDQQ